MGMEVLVRANLFRAHGDARPRNTFCGESAAAWGGACEPFPIPGLSISKLHHGIQSCMYMMYKQEHAHR
jgi:hypothetical protein